MSLFKRLFTRKITYVEEFIRDARYPDQLHLFGAIRVMPDEGDSFDIWRHCLIDANTFQVTNGLQQRGNDFSIKSAFAKRALDEMSKQTGRQLQFNLETPKDAVKYYFADSNDTDTAELQPLPREGVLCTKLQGIESKERFRLELIRSGQIVATHTFKGLADYFRHSIFIPEKNLLYSTYRHEPAMGIGGMAFYVLNIQTGELLHDDYIK